ncbi:MAG: zinc-binding dehydrogenase [Halobacteria archaeon]|nr:zinc-binding dehydrogenase [Halobacteria archaeon]
MSAGKVVTLAGEKEVEIVEIDELPDVGENAVLTSVKQTNVCGSEIHFWKGEFPVPNGAVLGHEAVLEVEELGENITTDSAGQNVEEGDLITPVYFNPCGECAGCSNGQFYACELVKSTGDWMQPHSIPPHFRGTFATHYYIQPDQNFYKIPENVPNHVAASANCALSQVMFSLEKADLTRGEDLVIQGAGGLGINAIAVAKESGANVTVVEGADPRIERAKDFGADNVVDMKEFEDPGERVRRVQELTGGDGADVVLEVAGIPEAFVEGTSMVRTGGRYVEVGNISSQLTAEFSPADLTLQRTTVHAVLFYQPWYLRKSLEFLSEHAADYPYDDLLDATFPLEEAQRALEGSASQEFTRASLIPEE